MWHGLLTMSGDEKHSSWAEARELGIFRATGPPGRERERDVQRMPTCIAWLDRIYNATQAALFQFDGDGDDDPAALTRSPEHDPLDPADDADAYRRVGRSPPLSTLIAGELPWGRASARRAARAARAAATADAGNEDAAPRRVIGGKCRPHCHAPCSGFSNPSAECSGCDEDVECHAGAPGYTTGKSGLSRKEVTQSGGVEAALATRQKIIPGHRWAALDEYRCDLERIPAAELEALPNSEARLARLGTAEAVIITGGFPQSEHWATAKAFAARYGDFPLRGVINPDEHLSKKAGISVSKQWPKYENTIADFVANTTTEPVERSPNTPEH